MSKGLDRYISQLDSDRFGIVVAKVNEFELPIKNMVHQLKAKGVKLILTRVSLENINLINELEVNGFQLKDVQLTYKYDLGLNKPLVSLVNGIDFRDAVASDVCALVALCKESFNAYGHYSADKRLDQDKCNEVYTDWISRCVLDHKVADKVVVAQVNGQVAGFIALKKAESLNYSFGQLGAVGRQYRNLGIFKSLVTECVNWGREELHQWQEHNVLVNNYPVQRVLISLGFRTNKSVATFHSWL